MRASQTDVMPWQRSTEEALSVVQPLLLKGVLLHKNDIPLLLRGAWQGLDGVLKSRKTIEVKRSEPDAELLCWIRGFALYQDDKTRWNKMSGQLLMQALAYGAHTNAFAALSELAEDLGLDRTSSPPEKHYPVWLDHRFKLARLYKRQGRFREAIALTAKLAETPPADLPPEARLMAEARILLHAAKAASSHDLRIGMGLVLSRLATERIRHTNQEEKGYGVMLARAIDTQMGIEFDYLVANAGKAPDIDSALKESMFERWQEAVDLDEELENPTPRTAFRQLRARFECATTAEERERCREHFRALLSRKGHIGGDIRGRAIREGQYAAMATRMQQTDAEEYAKSALSHAKRVCDWPTAASNLARLATIRQQALSQNRTAGEEARSLLDDAKTILENMEEAPTTLHLTLCKMEARLCQLLGDWKCAHQALEEADSHLEKTVKRLSRESAELLLVEVDSPNARPGNHRSHAPTAILTEEECHSVAASLAADWNIVTTAQRDLMRHLATAGAFITRDEKQQMSLRRLVRYGATIVHRVKNNYRGSFGKIKEVAREHRDSTDSLRLALTEAIDLSTQQLVDSLSKGLRLHEDGEGSQIEFHSAHRLVTLSEEAMNDLRAVAPDLKYEVVMEDDGDFRVAGFATEIEMHLFPFYENAARVLGQADASVPRQLVTCTVSWVGTANATTENAGAYGCIEIRDSGGRIAELQNAIEAVQAGPVAKWHGLDMAISFLRDEYDCQISAFGVTDEYSVVRILFPQGARVICA